MGDRGDKGGNSLFFRWWWWVGNCVWREGIGVGMGLLLV